MRAPEDGVCEDDDVYKKRGKGEKKGPPPPKNLGFFLNINLRCHKNALLRDSSFAKQSEMMETDLDKKGDKKKDLKSSVA